MAHLLNEKIGRASSDPTYIPTGAICFSLRVDNRSSRFTMGFYRSTCLLLAVGQSSGHIFVAGERRALCGRFG